jgi:hypothetical protein
MYDATNQENTLVTRTVSALPNLPNSDGDIKNRKSFKINYRIGFFVSVFRCTLLMHTLSQSCRGRARPVTVVRQKSKTFGAEDIKFHIAATAVGLESMLLLLYEAKLSQSQTPVHTLPVQGSCCQR